MDEMYHKGRQAMDETYQQGTRLVDGFVNEVLHDNQGGYVTYHADEEYRILGMSVITFIAVAVSVGVVFIVLICALCCWCCHCCCCAKKTQQVMIYPPNPNNNPLNVSTTTYAPLPTGPGLPPDPGFVNQLYTQQRGRQGFSDDEMLEVQCYDQDWICWQAKRAGLLIYKLRWKGNAYSRNFLMSSSKGHFRSAFDSRWTKPTNRALK